MSVDLTRLIDLDLLAYFKSKLDLVLAGKVSTETGKGLSSNDYTSTEKAKLANIAESAQVNVLEGIQRNGVSISLTNKIANISVPVNTSDLTNDSGFITTNDIPEGSAASTTTPAMNGTAAVGTELAFARGDHVHPTDTSRAPLVSPDFSGTPTAPTAAAGTNTLQIATTAFVNTALSGKANAEDVYTKTEINSMISGVMTYKGTKTTIDSLPSSGNAQGDVWHVTADNGEYAWNGSAWEFLGVSVDLSGYVESDDIDLATTVEIDALFASGS